MAVLENSLKTFDFSDKYALYALPEYICNYIDIRSGYIKILLCASLRESSFTFSNNETQDIYQTWDKIFKNGPSKICGKPPLKILLGPFVNTLSHMGVCTTFDRNGSISEHFIGDYSFSKVVWTSFQSTIPCVLLKSISTIF